MKRLAIIASIALSLTIVAATAVSAQAGSEFTLTGLNSSSSITLQAGASFNVDVNLTTDMSTNGFSLFLQSSGAGFSLTSDTASFTAASNPMAFANSSLTLPLSIPITGDTPDLGFAANNPSENSAASGGPYLLETLTLDSTTTPGQYTIRPINTTVADAAGNEEDQALGQISTTPLTVDVISTPEPTPLALFGVGITAGLMLLGRRRRHQRIV